MRGAMSIANCTQRSISSGEQASERPTNENREQKKHARRKSGSLQTMPQRCPTIEIMVMIFFVGDQERDQPGQQTRNDAKQHEPAVHRNASLSASQGFLNDAKKASTISFVEAISPVSGALLVSFITRFACLSLLCSMYHVPTPWQGEPRCLIFLSQHFTLGELQQVYEAILRKRLDKRNFRKKMLATGVLERIEEQKREGVHHRPARLYRLHLPGKQRSAHA